MRPLFQVKESDECRYFAGVAAMNYNRPQQLAHGAGGSRICLSTGMRVDIGAGVDLSAAVSRRNAARLKDPAAVPYAQRATAMTLPPGKDNTSGSKFAPML
jgi:hypothetical protein